MYSDTVTLFNRLHTREEDLWYPTVLRGVDLNVDRAAIAAKYGAESQDKAMLHVKFAEDGGLLVSGKLWLPPKEWLLLSKENMECSLTFTAGEHFDFFFEGEWEGTEPIPNSRCSPDGFYDYMNQRYDNVFVITSVARYSVIPHFEITGS